MRRPSSRASDHSPATMPRSADPGAADPNAILVEGPAASRRRANSRRVVGSTASSLLLWCRAAGTKTVRSPESEWAWSAATAKSSSDRRCDQSTTVLIPASAAPSKPIRVAA